ncbi:cytochrome c, class I [Hydrogenophaga crassostreae]|uniref:Cytochrome c, class I n=1 Tax=Hydrogenophaga crassostreae TaxID=1763535 RepID=A0A167IR91_9BURK|nr:c-type cytochrome [Hydrogenophaga crassostreae]AOW14497.1 cytochrome c, class I [Hydrogenophaga crassostreae]OAD43479.1 cytochrome c, class I [Hydrogenophaga crassostreae]
MTSLITKRAVAAGILLLIGHASVWAQADEARARKIAGGSCFLCHGAQGESTSDIFPRLAGQHAAYIAKQLEAFKSGQRKSNTMADMVAKLTPDEMLALGRYYEKMPTHPSTSKEPQLAAMGQYIYQNGNKFSGVPACASCHGPDAQGTSTLPRLASQIPGYIHTQLKSFNKRERTNDNAVMHAVVEKMTELEMVAVAEYVSGK